MGAGAGALQPQQAPGLHQKVGPEPASGEDGGSGGSGQQPSVDYGAAQASVGVPASSAVEGGIAWLLSAIDREKAEKEWLANKYEWLATRFDEKCVEVRKLQEELAVARNDLHLAKTLLEEKKGVGSKGSSLTEVLRAQGVLTTSGPAVSSTSPMVGSNSLPANTAAPASSSGREARASGVGVSIAQDCSAPAASEAIPSRQKPDSNGVPSPSSRSSASDLSQPATPNSPSSCQDGSPTLHRRSRLGDRRQMTLTLKVPMRQEAKGAVVRTDESAEADADENAASGAGGVDVCPDSQAATPTNMRGFVEKSLKEAPDCAPQVPQVLVVQSGGDGPRSPSKKSTADVEPMSALLRRRTEDWSSRSVTATQSGDDGFKAKKMVSGGATLPSLVDPGGIPEDEEEGGHESVPTLPRVRAKSDGNVLKELAVCNSKVALLEDCPTSPKRPRKRGQSEF